MSSNLIHRASLGVAQSLGSHSLTAVVRAVTRHTSDAMLAVYDRGGALKLSVHVGRLLGRYTCDAEGHYRNVCLRDK